MIVLDGICKSFGSLRAVDHLSIKVARGELFGLLGPNGAGKSTTIGMAVGLIAPDHGAVLIDGASPADRAVRARLGVAPQALALYEDLSAAENLTFFGRMQGLSGARLRERVGWALDFVELAARQRDRVKGYSGGMKRRLNLAAAIVHDPPLILLDEPTVGVDPQSRNAIFENILSLKREGRTIVYTTHYMEEAQRLCDRIAIIDHGKLLALDTAPRLIERHGGKCRLTIEGPEGKQCIETDDPLGELGRRQAASALTGFRVDQPDLERVFLNLTGRELRD